MTNLKFTGSVGDNVEESSNYHIIDVPFQFFCYHPIYSVPENISKYYNPSGMPRSLFNHTLASIGLPSGYLYTYNEKTKHWEEYFVGGESMLHEKDGKAKEESKSLSSTVYLKIPKVSTNVREHNINAFADLSKCTIISFNQDDIIWVAYSKCQWTWEYLNEVMSDFENKIKKRFEKINVQEWITTCEDIDASSSPKSLNWIYDSDKSYNYILYSYNDNLLESSNVDEESDRKRGRVYQFTLNNPIYLVDRMIKGMEENIKYLGHFIDSTMRGADPDDESGSTQGIAEVEESFALFSSASMLNKLLYQKGGALSEYAKEENVQQSKIERLLGLKERDQLVLNIMNLREDIYRVITSSAYQNVVVDYCAGSNETKIVGQADVLNHLKSLLVHPIYHDLDPYTADDIESITKKDEIKEYAKKILFLEEGEVYMRPEFIGDGESEEITKQLLGTSIDFASISKNSSVYAYQVLYNLDALLSLYKNLVTQLSYGKKTHLQTMLRVLGMDKANVITEADDLITEIRDRLANNLRAIGKYPTKIVDNAVFGGYSKAEFHKHTIRGKTLPESPHVKKATVMVAELERVIELDKIKAINRIDNNIADVRAQILEINEKAVNPAFLQSPVWARFLVSFSSFNLTVSIFSVMNRGMDVEVVIPMLGAGVELLAVSASLAFRSRDAMAFEIQLLRRLKLNPKLTIGTRISFIGLSIQAVADIFRMVERIKYANYDAALCYGISAISASVSIYAINAVSVAGGSCIWGPVGWALAGLSLACAAGIIFFSDDDIESFLKCSVFTGDNGKILGIGFFKNKTLSQAEVKKLKPYEVMQKLYNEKEKLAIDKFYGLGQHIEMQEMSNMYTALLRLSSPISISHSKPWFYRNFNGKGDWLCEDVHIAVNYAGEVCMAKKFHYEMRIYPHGTGYQLDSDYFKIKTTTRECDVLETKTERVIVDGKQQIIQKDTLVLRFEFGIQLSDFYKKNKEIMQERDKAPILVFVCRFDYTDGRHYPMSQSGDFYWGLKIPLKVLEKTSPKRLNQRSILGNLATILKAEL